MKKIRIESDPVEERVVWLGVYEWTVWKKEVSEFEWEYDEKETAYFIEGEAVITPEGGEPVTVGKRDIVWFPQGMKCHWKITKPVKKYYMIG